MGKIEFSGGFKRHKAALKAELKAELRAELKVEIRDELRLELREQIRAELRDALRRDTRDLSEWVHANDIDTNDHKSAVDNASPPSPVCGPQSGTNQKGTCNDINFSSVEMMEGRYCPQAEKANGDAFRKGPIVDAGGGGAPGDEAKYQEVSLDASLWDAAILIGSPLVGLGGSVVLGVLLAVNFAIQVAMILILHVAGLTSPSIGIDEVEQLRNWRLFIAHDFKYFNPLSQQTLAARVCAIAQQPYLPSTLKHQPSTLSTINHQPVHFVYLV
jgi:hypothetical protein